MTARDPVLEVLSLPGVAQELAAARDTIDAVRGRRAVWKARPEVAVHSQVLGAWANAALDGVHVPLAQYLSGAAVDDSPQGRVLAGAGVLTESAPRLSPLVGTAPAQVITEMAVLSGTALLGGTARPPGTESGSAAHSPDLGQPRATDTAADPLHLGPLPPPGEVRQRLAGVSALLRESAAPGLLVTAITHAELAWLRPFAVGSGLACRALDRLILAQRGVDPDFLVTPELGIWQSGRSAYVRALQGYAVGTPRGLTEWIGFYCQAVAGRAAASAEAAGVVPAAGS